MPRIFDESKRKRRRRRPNGVIDRCTQCKEPISTTRKRMEAHPRYCWQCYSESKRLNLDQSTGYIRIGHDFEHRIAAEAKEGEVVHHLNRIRDDNRPENLALCASHREHLDTYHQGELVPPSLHHNGRRPKGSPGWNQ